MKNGVIVWLFLLVSPISAIADLPSPSDDQRVFLWTYPSEKLAIEQPMKAIIAGETIGQYQLGFTHSGYTVSGQPRRASLLLAVELINAPLTPVERADLTSRGYRFVPVKSLPVFAYLDVTLERDVKEESRLRSLLSLPRRIPLGSVHTFNISWSDVPGRQLYDWLTSTDGLAFRFTFELPLAFCTDGAWRLDSSKFERWWQSVGGTATTVDWFGGATALAVDIVMSGSVMAVSEALFPEVDGPNIHDISSLSSAIDTKSAKRADGTSSLSKEDLRGIMTTTMPCGQMPPIRLRASATRMPGQVLDANPSLVIDASGTSVGLGAIKGK